MAPTELAQALGWVGSVLSGGAYVAVSTGLLGGDRAPFQILNILGAIGLGIAAMSAGVWSSASMNGLWIVIGLTALAMGRRRGARPGPGARRCGDRSRVQRVGWPGAVAPEGDCDGADDGGGNEHDDCDRVLSTPESRRKEIRKNVVSKS